MTLWCSKDLGDGVQAFAPTKEIQNVFLPLFAASGQPIDMSVFSLYDLEKNIVTAYFSPGAAALAKMFGASPCEKPRNEGRLSLLVGDARCWQLFYPTEQ